MKSDSTVGRMHLYNSAVFLISSLVCFSIVKNGYLYFMFLLFETYMGFFIPLQQMTLLYLSSC